MFLSPTARKFKYELALCCPDLKLKGNELLDVSIDIHENWWYKNGKVRKADCHNRLKIILDALATRYHDDSYFWQTTVTKVQQIERSKFGLMIRIQPYKETTNVRPQPSD